MNRLGNRMSWTAYQRLDTVKGPPFAPPDLLYYGGLSEFSEVNSFHKNAFFLM